MVAGGRPTAACSPSRERSGTGTSWSASPAGIAATMAGSGRSWSPASFSESATPTTRSSSLSRPAPVTSSTTRENDDITFDLKPKGEPSACRSMGTASPKAGVGPRDGSGSERLPMDCNTKRTAVPRLARSGYGAARARRRAPCGPPPPLLPPRRRCGRADRVSSGRRVPLQDPCRFQPVDDRDGDVHEDQCRQVLPCLADRVLSVERLGHAVAGELEHRAVDRAIVLVVFDQEDQLLHGCERRERSASPRGEPPARPVLHRGANQGSLALIRSGRADLGAGGSRRSGFAVVAPGGHVEHDPAQPLRHVTRAAQHQHRIVQPSVAPV